MKRGREQLSLYLDIIRATPNSCDFQFQSQLPEDTPSSSHSLQQQTYWMDLIMLLFLMLLCMQDQDIAEQITMELASTRAATLTLFTALSNQNTLNPQPLFSVQTRPARDRHLLRMLSHLGRSHQRIPQVSFVLDFWCERGVCDKQAQDALPKLIRVIDDSLGSHRKPCRHLHERNKKLNFILLPCRLGVCEIGKMRFSNSFL